MQHEEVHEFDRIRNRRQMLCERFEWHRDVDLLIVGGAAAMLSGLLPADRVTGDCDVINYMPENALAAVEGLAEVIGHELNLPQHWFNSNIALQSDLLPDGWGERRVLVRAGARLRVYAASRLDLLAMKFMAHRPQDLEDIQHLDVTLDDKLFVAEYLSALPSRGTPPDAVAEAVEILQSWQIRDES